MRDSGLTSDNRNTQYPSLGKPAGFEDRIVQRRLNLLASVSGFIGREFSLVDIGCGNGASTFELAGRMKECLGIDVGIENQKAFEERRQALEIHNCRFLRLDIESEYIGEKFDRLISFEVVEHLRDERSVRKYHELLKDGGMAAISVPNKWWIFETHGARLPLLPWNRVPFFSWLPRPIHERFARARIYTKKRISRLLSDSGFEILQMSYITAPMDVLWEGWVKRVLTETVFRKDTVTVPFLATSIFVVVRKSTADNRS